MVLMENKTSDLRSYLVISCLYTRVAVVVVSGNVPLAAGVVAQAVDGLPAVTGITLL